MSVWRSVLGLLLGGVFSLACDIPECIDGPSNLTPESTASCVPSPTPSESAIVSAGAEFEQGSLTLTLTSWGLECGARADQFMPSDDCDASGWIFTVVLPPELAVAGVIDLASHPELQWTMSVANHGNAGSHNNLGDVADLVGQLELTDVGEGCVTGVLHGVGSNSPDPTLGGPELEGSFVAPTC